MKKNGNGKKSNNLKVRIIKFDLWKIGLAVLGILIIAPIILGLLQTKIDSSQEDLSRAMSDIKDKKVDKVSVEGNKLLLTYKDGSIKISTKEDSISFPELLDRSGIDPKSVNYTISDQSVGKAFGDIVGFILPLAITAVVILFIMRAQNKGASDIFSFGKSRAKLFAKGKQDVTFADVAGVDEAKRELEEVVDFLKNPAKYRAIGARTPKGVLLFGPAGVGKCVVGDTIVWTNKGLMEMKDVPRYYYVDPKSSQVFGANLASFDIKDTTGINTSASHWYNLGEQETIKIRLAQGFTIEGTPEHPIIVMTSDGVLKFRKLGNIQEGDDVVIQFGARMFGNLNLVDQDTAYLMGVLTGDGNMSHSSRVGLTNIDPEIIKFFKKYVNDHYNKSAITKNKQSYLVANWDFKKYLYQMGMSYLLSFDKIIPPTILQSPEEVQKAFLKGLFDTDASIYRDRATFEYTTVSRKMAEQVQMLLLNIGIVASLNVKGKIKDGYFRSVYRITLTGSSLVSFGRLLGFRLTRKQRVLNGHMRRMKRVNTNIDVIPGIGKKIEESWKKLSNKKLSNEKLSRIIDKVRNRDRISRQTLFEYVRYCNDFSLKIPNLEYLRSILESNLFFSRVVEKSFGREVVYDFTVPQTHSFLANGFLNHNTLLAKAVAGEAGVPFFSMAGSEFMEMLVGIGASRVRDLFGQAKEAAPSIIFIDEIDAIGRQRGRGFIGGHDEREQTLNQILVEMDGFTPNDNVMVIAATNRGDLLDPALLRPGRFDRRVTLDMPDKEGRLAILKIHARGKTFAKSVNWGRVADRTVGFSGADLENMLNESAILAARNNKKEIDMTDVEEAATKVKLGPAKKRLQSNEDKKITAYHEGGHAIVTNFLPGMDPVHRISIVARGMSLGHTLIPPAADRTHETRTRLANTITAMLGGRAAEEVVFNEMTSGASNDIEKATSLARSMVVDFGMSSLGPINYGNQTDYGEFGNPEYMEGSKVSPAMLDKIDIEVKKIIDIAYRQAVSLVKKYRKDLDKVANELLKKETLDRDEFEKIVGKKENGVSK